MNRRILFATAALALLSPIGLASAQTDDQNGAMATDQSSGTMTKDQSSGAMDKNKSGAMASDQSGAMAGDQSADAMAAMNVTTAAEFVPMAAMSDKFEIESSKVALKSAKSDSVKQFAQQMIDDHTANSKMLMQAVKDAGGKMNAPRKLDKPHQAMLKQLRGAPGTQFDAMYINEQMTAHQQAVALFTSYAKKGDNKVLASYAKQALPTLQMHLDMVQKLAGSM
jgi:putative membrane protein